MVKRVSCRVSLKQHHPLAFCVSRSGRCFPLTQEYFWQILFAQDVTCYVHVILKWRHCVLPLPARCTLQHLKHSFMPRPHKADDLRRTERFELRLSINEAHELVTRALNAGISTADYIRKSTLGDHAYMQQATPDQAAMINTVTELTRIGNVLSQIVRSGKYASSPEQVELLTETLLAVKTLSGHLIKKLSS
jgi:hypothetical protein